MGASFNGSTQKAQWANPYNPTAAPTTMAAWIKPTSVAANQYLAQIETSVNDFGYFIWIGALAGRYQTNRRMTTSRFKQAPDGTLTSGSWQHVLSTDSGASSAAAMNQYKNGSLLSVAAFADGSGTEATFTGQLVLAGRTADNIRNYNGLLAEVAIWNRVLDATERGDLAAGKSPLFIPTGLVCYAPLTVADQWLDHISEVSATLTASPTIVSDHPTIEYPPPPGGGGPGRGQLLSTQRNRLVRPLT